jgi:hypothetical protein
MRLRYIGEDGNLKIGGRGLMNGETLEGTEALLERGDFELAEDEPEEPNEEIE